MTVKQGSALAGFIILGLSPSFLDWSQSPDKHGQFIGFYAVAIALIYWGVLRP